MIDTIRLSIETSLTDPAERFPVGKPGFGSTMVKGGTTKYYHNPPIEESLPRLTYLEGGYRGNRLLVEVSLIRMIGKGKPLLLTWEQVREALAGIESYLDVMGFGHLPSLSVWSCTRCDYYYQWDIGPDESPHYISAMKELKMGNYIVTQYPHGVQWRNGGSSITKRIKFYDKAENLGLLDVGLLRYEVSLFAPATNYMAKREYGERPELRHFDSEVMASNVLHEHWSRLGVDSLFVSGGDMKSIGEVFGVANVGIVTHFIDVYHKHGVEAWKQGYITRGQYYKWLKRVRDAGFLQDEVTHLPPLSLPPKLSSVTSGNENPKRED